MSAITREEVARVAGLARIDLEPDELETLSGQLGLIVEAMQVVTEAAGGDVPATSHPIALVNVYRSDVVQESLSVEDALSSAPEVEAGRFKVPQILGEEP